MKAQIERELNFQVKKWQRTNRKVEHKSTRPLDLKKNWIQSRKNRYTIQRLLSMKIKHRSPVKYGCKEKAYTHRSKKQTHRWKKKERLYITVTLNVSLFAPAHKNAADWIIRPRLFFVLLLDVDICHRPPKASGHHCRAFVTFTVFFWLRRR